MVNMVSLGMQQHSQSMHCIRELGNPTERMFDRCHNRKTKSKWMNPPPWSERQQAQSLRSNPWLFLSTKKEYFYLTNHFGSCRTNNLNLSSGCFITSSTTFSIRIACEPFTSMVSPISRIFCN